MHTFLVFYELSVAKRNAHRLNRIVKFAGIAIEVSNKRFKLILHKK